MIHILLITLFLLSYQDLMHHEIDISIFIVFLIMSLQGSYYINAALSLFILNIIFFITNKIAYADILTISACSNLIPIEDLGIFYILISFSSAIYALYKKTKIIPLIPCITISFILIYFKVITFNNLPL